MTRLFAAAGILLGLTASAFADPAASSEDALVQTFDPESAVAPVSVVEGAGVKVGEGTVLHPIFGVETGFVSNVFYADTNVQPAGILRLLAQIGTGSLSKERLTPAGASDESANDEEVNTGSLTYRADLRASYDLVLSGNNAASGTGGLGVGASLHGLVNPMGQWQFGFDEDFTRLIRAANFETDANTNRDINRLMLAINLRPSGRSLSASLYYANVIDIFEKTVQRFPDRIEHRGGIHGAWQFFPRTQAYVDGSFGVVTGLGSSSSMKVSSFPLVVKAGIATLLTVKTTLNVEGGYTNGFYSSGPSFSAPLINAQVGYRYSPLGRVALGYSLQYSDSINANYYRDHVLRLWMRQLVTPFVVMVQPEVHLREYSGIPPTQGAAVRDDVIFSVIAGMSYNFRNWLAATLNYRFTDVTTSYRYMSGGMSDDPSFVRHELLLGMRAAL